MRKYIRYTHYNGTFSKHKIRSIVRVSVYVCERACHCSEIMSVTLFSISFYKYNNTLNKHKQVHQSKW